MSREKFKIVSLDSDDILLDAAGAADALVKACSRMNRSWRVTGVCDCGHGVLMFPAEVCAAEERPSGFVFAPMPSSDPDDVAAELSLRYSKGLLLIGTFRCGSDLWALWARP